MTKPLSKADCVATAKAFNAAEGNLTVAAAELGLRRSSFQDRLARTQQRYPELIKSFEVSKGGPARKEPKTLEQDVEVHKAKSEASSYKSKLGDAVKQLAGLQQSLADLRWAAKMQFEPAEWTLPTHSNKKREHTPVLMTSDFQVGEVIDAKLVETGIGYNSEIFQRRYRQMIDTTIYLSFQHAGTNWTYPGIIYLRGGDSISNDIHEELMVTNDLTPLEAVQLCFEEEAAGIRKLADAFGKVDVKTPGAGGNHDRCTPHGKPFTKQLVGRNFDALIAFMLGREFKADKRVTFQTSDSFDVRFPIYGAHHLLTHGDRMGSKGGQGFVGPAATILRGVAKVMAEQATLGHPVDCIWHGHFHYVMDLPFVHSNGCMPGYSEFAKQWRMRPDDPKQTLAYFHPERGMVDLKPLNLKGA
jgi:hypothetical protein